MKKAFLIHYDGYYDIRLKYVEQELVERGFQVTLVFSDFDHFSKSKKAYNFKNLIKIAVPEYKKNISLRRINSYLSFSKQVKSLVDKEKPNLVYAIIPPNSLAKLLTKSKKLNPKMKLILDVFDLYPEQMPKFDNNPVANYWRNLRNKNLKKADYVILECKYYEKVLGKYLDESKSSVLYLNKAPLEVPYKLKWNEEQLNIAYLGSINYHIDIDKIVEFLTEISKQKKILFRIIGDGQKREELLEKLNKNGIEYIFFGRTFDESEKRKILEKCQFGINIYRQNLGIGVTLKSLDYYQIGLPIINYGMYDNSILTQSMSSGIDLESLSSEEGEKKIKNLSSLTWQKMVDASSRIFDEKFSDEVYQEKLNEIINKLKI